jgi:predicted DNA-binding transcriptional regulator YafY
VVERGAAGGFELLGGWRTTLTGLTPDEAQSLFLAGLPGPVAQLGLGDTMASAQLKLLAALPREWQAEAQRVSSRFHVDLAGWYRRVGPTDNLRALADAVWTDRRVTVRYESWKGEVDRELEPLGLVIKAGDWYVVARPAGRDADPDDEADRRGRRPGGLRGRDRSPRTYRVSNIRALRTEGAFARPKRFDLGAFWRQSTHRFESELVRGSARVRLTRRGRRLLRGLSAAIDDAVDRAAEMSSDPDVLEADIPVESIDHATSQLLALGTEVEVLSPEELRESMRVRARAVAAIYEPRRALRRAPARRPSGRPRR